MLGACLGPYLLFAQDPKAITHGPNLIPNPSFETLRDEIPDDDLSGSKTFRNCLEGWTSPTKTTPDLHLLINSIDEEFPRTGENMAAILTHNPQSTRSDTWREYIQVKLDAPLKYGAQYYFECYVRQHKQSALCSNNIGMSLSPPPLSQ